MEPRTAEPRLTTGTVFLADCPARLAIQIIADEWARGNGEAVAEEAVAEFRESLGQRGDVA